MTDGARAQKIINLLKKAYPNVRIVLRYGNPWELLVAVVLSAQCTDVMVNKVTEKLFVKYKTLDDYIKAKPAVFEQDIKSTGFFRKTNSTQPPLKIRGGGGVIRLRRIPRT